jgi:hypothetical protein
VALIAVVVISAIGTLGKPMTSPFEPAGVDVAAQATTAPKPADPARSSALHRESW